MSDAEEHEFTRREMAITVVLAAAVAATLLALYYTLPFQPRPHDAVWWRVIVLLGVFLAVLSHEVNSILRHGQPMGRAVIALALLLPLFVVMFAWLYLTMSRSNPAAFGVAMTCTQALYFTVTVLSTVGFGDITPKTDPARLVTTVQMAADLVLLAVVVRLIFGAASRAVEQRKTTGSGEANA